MGRDGDPRNGHEGEQDDEILEKGFHGVRNFLWLELKINEVGRSGVDVHEHDHGGRGIESGLDNGIRLEDAVNDQLHDQWDGIHSHQ